MKDSCAFRLAYGILATLGGGLATLITMTMAWGYFAGTAEDYSPVALLISIVFLASGICFLVSTIGMIRHHRDTWRQDDAEPTPKTVNGIDIDKVPYKSKATAIVLCLLLGAIGIHRIYIGHTGSGILMTIMMVIGFWTIVFPVYFILVSIIDLISIASGHLKDAYNRPLI